MIIVASVFYINGEELTKKFNDISSLDRFINKRKNEVRTISYTTLLGAVAASVEIVLNAHAYCVYILKYIKNEYNNIKIVVHIEVENDYK